MPTTGVSAKMIAYIVSVIDLPDVDLENLPLDRRECCICREEYEDTPWQLGETIHRPILLDCGHTFGTPCLARWAHSSRFSNHCPLCRGQIYVQPTDSTIPQVESLLEAIYGVQNICSSHPTRDWCDEKEAFCEEQKRNLYDDLRENGSELAMEHTMVFLDAHIHDWRLTSRTRYRIVMLSPEEQQNRRPVRLRTSRN